MDNKVVSLWGRRRAGLNEQPVPLEGQDYIKVVEDMDRPIVHETRMTYAHRCIGVHPLLDRDDPQIVDHLWYGVVDRINGNELDQCHFSLLHLWMNRLCLGEFKLMMYMLERTLARGYEAAIVTMAEMKNGEIDERDCPNGHAMPGLGMPERSIVSGLQSLEDKGLLIIQRLGRNRARYTVNYATVTAGEKQVFMGYDRHDAERG